MHVDNGKKRDGILGRSNATYLFCIIIVKKHVCGGNMKQNCDRFCKGKKFFIMESIIRDLFR